MSEEEEGTIRPLRSSLARSSRASRVSEVSGGNEGTPRLRFAIPKLDFAKTNADANAAAMSPTSPDSSATPPNSSPISPDRPSRIRKMSDTRFDQSEERSRPKRFRRLSHRNAGEVSSSDNEDLNREAKDMDDDTRRQLDRLMGRAVTTCYEERLRSLEEISRRNEAMIIDLKKAEQKIEQRRDEERRRRRSRLQRKKELERRKKMAQLKLKKKEMEKKRKEKMLTLKKLRQQQELEHKRRKMKISSYIQTEDEIIMEKVEDEKMAEKVEDEKIVDATSERDVKIDIEEDDDEEEEEEEEAEDDFLDYPNKIDEDEAGSEGVEKLTRFAINGVLIGIAARILYLMF